MAKDGKYVIIARCSCFAQFTYSQLDMMQRHITENNKKVHKWEYVPDIKITSELVDKKSTD